MMGPRYRTVQYVDDEKIIRTGVERVAYNGTSFIGDLERIRKYPLNYGYEGCQALSSIDRETYDFERDYNDLIKTEKRTEYVPASSHTDFTSNGDSNNDSALQDTVLEYPSASMGAMGLGILGVGALTSFLRGDYFTMIPAVIASIPMFICSYIASK